MSKSPSPFQAASPHLPSRGRTLLLLASIIASTIVGLAGTDLVLPAVPQLADFLHGTSTQAQMVLASFVAGVGIGLLLFGEVGARWDQRMIIVAALGLYGLFSVLATLVTSLQQLIALRFLQGLASSAAAVFAPVMIRTLLPENQAIRAIGVMSSIESLTPALAPILGAWLLAIWGWQASFWTVAVACAALLVIWWRLYPTMPVNPPLDSNHHYGRLLRHSRFLLLANSQACALGGLLVFVFAAPALFAGPLGGDIRDFVIMQMIGVSFFIASASSSHWWVEKFGRAPMICAGSVISLIGATGLCLYGFAIQQGWAATHNWAVWLLFIWVNLGFGVRGPPGFYAALESAGADSARASALIILLVILVAAAGTALIAPFISQGLFAIGAVVTAIFAAAWVLFLFGHKG
ncbi:MFS transporter [Halioxenophilus aromaticivorans]|uniref:MFS transporter n=1 Tax=Halioxenophilus aromaticivorans TaxID=1306992 RepID=A0AAV3U2U6_9ALTE